MPILTPAVPPEPTTYEVDGRRYPRVTTVLRVLARPQLDGWYRRHGFERCDELSAAARAFGTRLHAALEAFNGDPETWSMVGSLDDLTPYLDAYATWFNANVEAVLGVERRVVSRWHDYAGTVDLVVALKDGARAVVDFKTANRAGCWPEYRLQLAAYRQALGEEGMICTRRIVLQFLKSEPGRLVPHDLDKHRRDTELWLNVLAVWRGLQEL